MKLEIESKFEIGNYINIRHNGSFEGSGTIVDICINKNKGVRYLVELNDRSRLWYSEEDIVLPKE